MRALFKIPRSPPPTVKNPKDWTPVFIDFIKQCLIKDYDKRPTPRELLKHPFIAQAPSDCGPVQYKLRNLLVTLHGRMQPRMPSRIPIATTKRGKLKTNRKLKPEHTYGDDLAALEILDESIIVDHLYNRYIKGQIYTYVGDILIAVNPFCAQEIYTDNVRKDYFGCAKADNPPHVFGISDSVYHSLLQLGQNQCVVISGESGSGKTENAKHLIQHLANLGRSVNKNLEQKILTINPIMEAFGNAKTGINDNSSRFGKYLEMLFATNGKVIGAKLSEYLLEKGRVVSQAASERNFHVLYYIYDGLGRNENQPDDSYHLRPTHRHRYLGGYAGDNISLVSAHREHFMVLHKSLNTLGFKMQDLTSMYRILAAVLHLGDVQFITKEVKHMPDKSVVSNLPTLETVGKLLGVEISELRDALTSEMVVTRGETILKSHTVSESRNVRDSLAKALYGRLFDWIVNKINQLLNPNNTAEHDALTIGILDIFGFENFAQNSFEQLCINITNEQLQYYFNHSVFTWEQKEYAEEGLDWIPIMFCDNRPILDLFLSKPVGLLALLDEESRFPKASDHSLAEKFHHNVKSPYYHRNKMDAMRFSVEHYAGKIEYDVHGFLEKNRDYLATDIIQLMRTSEVPLLRTLFQNPLTKTGNLYEAVAFSDRSAINVNNSSSINVVGSVGLMHPKFNEPKNMNNYNKRLRTLASQTRAQQSLSTYFRYSLMDLLTKIVSSTPHFIRCIKPNDQKLPNFFCTEKVRLQLLYTGVLETARIRREGFAFRIAFSEFVKRYHMLVSKHDEDYSLSAATCRKILQRLHLEGWAIGKTKVFLKYYHIDHLAKLIKRVLDAAIVIQSSVRRWIARKRYLDYLLLRHHCASVIQKAFRGWRIRKHYRVLLEEKLMRRNQARRHMSRKRPCISPPTNYVAEADSSVEFIKNQKQQKKGVLPRGPKRPRESVENAWPKSNMVQYVEPNFAGCGRSLSEDSSAGRLTSFQQTPSPAAEDTENARSKPNTRKEADASKRPRVRDVIAVFERSTVLSDSGSEGNRSRSQSWKRDMKPDHSIERLHPQRNPLRNLTNQHPQPVSPAEAQVADRKSRHSAKKGESRPPKTSQVQANSRPNNENNKNTAASIATIEEVIETETHNGNPTDFRKFLKKSNWNPGQTLSKSHVPVGQVDFRGVLRNNRK
ncbi:myosin-IIIa-like isoform X2 [Paramacrobiotus metropolitanus]|nr:myosin-IIIa-like isoform X2 [Paramacrobiotus metropolitanus]